MMNNTTAQVLTGWMAANTGKVINYTDSITFNGKSVTWNTMRKYIDIQPIVTRTYYTLRQIVDFLNDCAGDDCYGATWNYQIDDNNQVYTDNVTGYKIIGWR